MNVLFVVGGGNLSSQIAQIALFLGLQQQGVNIYLIGNISEEVFDFLKEKMLILKHINIFILEKNLIKFIKKNLLIFYNLKKLILFISLMVKQQE